MVLEIVHSVCVTAIFTVWARSHVTPKSTYCFIEFPCHSSSLVQIAFTSLKHRRQVFGKLSLTIENFLFECVLLGRDRIREAQECIVPRVKTQDICQTTQRNKATPWGVETWHSKSFQRANFLIHLCTEVTGQRTCDSLKRTLHLNCWDSWVCKRNNSRIVRSMYGF